MLDDLEREIKRLKDKITDRNEKNARIKKIAQKLILKYLKPEQEELIKKNPYRIKAEIVQPREYGNFSKVIYRIEKQVRGFDFSTGFFDEYGFYENDDGDLVFETAWRSVGVFDDKREAEMALKEISKEACKR